MAQGKQAPTAAEEELQQREQGTQDPLPQQAKEERKQQREELKSGPEAAEVRGEVPAEMHRSDHVQLYSRTSGNRPDQYSMENPNEEVAYGHFCTVTGGENEGLFGVYVDTLTFKEDGSPDTVLVRERGASLQQFVCSYDDLAPAESRGTAPR